MGDLVKGLAKLLQNPFSVTRRHIVFLFGDRLKHQKAPNREETVVTRAERLVESIRAMPIEAVRERISSAQAMTTEELVERQRLERREWAQAAADSLAGDWQLPPSDESKVGED
ncbi:hypothetical protein [Agromyces lapidis]|uniref:Uncharacterized protein n=1 Tax=Agromyces lapidis TaxID=279574 RepID=A0ABV5SMF4_9MICO|nr:hypothetical protein [Agromyces lapidis]